MCAHEDNHVKLEPAEVWCSARLKQTVPIKATVALDAFNQVNLWPEKQEQAM